MKTILVTTLTMIIGVFLSSNLFALERSAADLERDKSSKPKQILSFLGVKKGDKVLDFLGGGGYYSQLLKSEVGSEGEVVLHTNQAYLSFVGKALKKRTESGGLDGVTQLISEADELKLGENQFDSAMLVLGYHDFFFKEGAWNFPSDKVIPQLNKALKKGGKLLIIDHASQKDAGISVVKSLHRIERDFVVKDLEGRGFKLIAESSILRNSKDSLNKSVFAKELRRKTDRFVLLFEKKSK